MSERIPTIRYRIIERIGSGPDEYAWLEVDSGTFTRTPRHYGPEPTWADFEAHAATFNALDDTRQIQGWIESRKESYSDRLSREGGMAASGKFKEKP